MYTHARPPMKEPAVSSFRETPDIMVFASAFKVRVWNPAKGHLGRCKYRGASLLLLLSTVVLAFMAFMLYISEISFFNSATSLFYFIRPPMERSKPHIPPSQKASVFAGLCPAHPPHNDEFKNFLRAWRGLLLKGPSGSGYVSRLTVALWRCWEPRSQRYGRPVRRDGRGAVQLRARLKPREEGVTGGGGGGGGPEPCLIRSRSHPPCPTARARPAS